MYFCVFLSSFFLISGDQKITKNVKEKTQQTHLKKTQKISFVFPKGFSHSPGLGNHSEISSKT